MILRVLWPPPSHSLGNIPAVVRDLWGQPEEEEEEGWTLWKGFWALQTFRMGVCCHTDPTRGVLCPLKPRGNAEGSSGILGGVSAPPEGGERGQGWEREIPGWEFLGTTLEGLGQ